MSILRRTLFVSCTVLATGDAEAAAHFAGSVTENDTTLAEFELSLDADREAVVSIVAGPRVELKAVSAKGDVGPRTEVRLFDALGRELHRATSPGDWTVPRSFAYAICDGAATFIAPAPATTPSCEDLPYQPASGM